MTDFAAIFGPNGFDANQVKPARDYVAVVPPGKYLVKIDKAELRQTKAQNGHLLWFEMTIIQGEYKDQKLFDQINVDNPSNECVRIGMGQFSALARAAGNPCVQNEKELVNAIVVAHVKVKADAKYGDSNEIRTYSQFVDVAEQQEPTVEPPMVPPSQEPDQAPTNQDTPAWLR